MNKSREDYELLAPAGSFESLKSAYMAGADAAYIGGAKFGARAFADSTGEDCIMKAIDYAHLRGKKLFLTVNTLLKEDEIKKELYDYLLSYYEQGLDAVIVQDAGVMNFIKTEFPGLSLHASTQMTITGVDGARLAKDMGASRIVTAREMSIEDIKDISRNVDIEIETFVHGAMCYCYSGQCLMSSLIGGRSGNRGRCAQPCRLPYDVKDIGGKILTEKDKNYILSLKDMCTIDRLPDLMEAGIYSFKIEGRMKSPVYTAGVVSIYRKYMDMYIDGGRENFKVDSNDRKHLLDLFDRGGQTDGYLRGIKGKEMMALKEKPSFRETNKALIESIEKSFVNAEDKVSISGYASFKIGQEANLSVNTFDVYAFSEHGNVLSAENRPMSKEDIANRLKKTGGTEFEFGELVVDADEGIFVSVKDINELRRSALQNLESSILDNYRRSIVQREDESWSITTNNASSEIMMHAYVEEDCQLDAVIKSGKVSTVYLDSAGFTPDKLSGCIDRLHHNNIKCIYVMPAIFKRSIKKLFGSQFIDLAKKLDGISVKNIDEAGWLTDNIPEAVLIGEPSLYSYNSQALDYYRRLGIKHFIMPYELNFKELMSAGHIGGELIVYGRTPVMISEQCVVKNTKGCNKCPSVVYLKDRKQMEFPVKNKCAFCYNMIYNSVGTSLAGLRDKVNKLRPSAVRLDFTVENYKETEKIIDLYYRTFILGEDMSSELSNYTKGHFSRGIE